MAETELEFVNSVAQRWADHGDIYEGDWSRLIAIARRGAAVVQWRPIEEAAQALIDFHNGPLDAKRPDVFRLLMQRLANALPPPPEKGE